MAKIFISSTFLDLQEHRIAVNRAVRRMGHEDVAMEYFTAQDARPVEKCLRDVAKCDVYVGLFAWRYGYVPPDKNPEHRAMTELEYREAVRLKKPCLIFLLDEDAAWSPRMIDENRAAIKKLRGELSQRHTVAFFKSPDDLAAVVGAALHEWEKQPASKRGAQVVKESDVFDREKYYAALRKRYRRLELDSLTPPQKEEYLQLQLRQVFIEQNARADAPQVDVPRATWERLSREREMPGENLPRDFSADYFRRARVSYEQKPPVPVLQTLARGRSRTVLLGNPGAGKTTLLRYVMLALLDTDESAKLPEALRGRVPFYLEIKRYMGWRAETKNAQHKFEDFLVFLSETEEWGVSRAALERFLSESPRAVILFDGLDEIFDPAQREEVARRIGAFASAHSSAAVVVTSRILGYNRKFLGDDGFEHFTLQDLDDARVKEFVTRWYDLALNDRPDEARALRERILQSFAKNPAIRELAGNPLLLTIMALIGKSQELPRERWRLYDYAAGVLVEHWDANRHLQDERIKFPGIGEAEKKELLRRLAFRMQSGAGSDDGAAGNFIHEEELEAEFAGYLQERYQQPPAQATDARAGDRSRAATRRPIPRAQFYSQLLRRAALWFRASRVSRILCGGGDRPAVREDQRIKPRTIKDGLFRRASERPRVARTAAPRLRDDRTEIRRRDYRIPARPESRLAKTTP